MPLKVTLLGTGTSTGIPVIGCSCNVCISEDPRDKRLRASCLIQTRGLTILVDAGPDFRTQALRAHIDQIDAVLITHHHFDHIAGLDDLRPYFIQNKNSIPCYAHPETVAHLKQRNAYIFQEKSYPGVANLDLFEINEPISVSGRYGQQETIEVIPINAYHGDIPVLGFRISNFTYLTDTNMIPAESFPLLENLDALVLDALRHEPHRSHYSITEAIQVAKRINAHKTYFTHMTHRLLHAEEDPLLPERISFAYDGLVIELDAP